MGKSPNIDRPGTWWWGQALSKVESELNGTPHQEAASAAPPLAPGVVALEMCRELGRELLRGCLVRSVLREVDEPKPVESGGSEARVVAVVVQLLGVQSGGCPVCGQLRSFPPAPFCVAPSSLAHREAHEREI